jgi:hypothetical protein
MRITSFFLLCATLLVGAFNAYADETYTPGYYRQDGTYVPPQYHPMASMDPSNHTHMHMAPSPDTAPYLPAPTPYAPQQALQAPSAPQPFGEGLYDYGN